MVGYFQSLLNADESTGDSYPADDPSLYSDTSFLSLLNINEEKPLLPLLDYAYGPTSPPASDYLATFNFFGNDLTENQYYHHLPEHDQKLTSSIDVMADNQLKMSTHEFLSNDFEFNHMPDEPFNFLSNISYPEDEYSTSNVFLQLPDLRSLESFQNDSELADESTRKRVKSFSPPNTGPYCLESIGIRNFQMSLPEVQAPPADLNVRSPRKRLRQTLGEKTRCLQKLLPSDKKMDMTTTFEEAYKYVKFLEAQVSVLKKMPRCCSSSNFVSDQSPSNVVDVYGGGLGRLNRNQLLQVFVNSPVAQTVMYSQGFCIYSIEQLALLNQQMMLFDIPSSMLY